jgi:hypothetical protein
MYSLDLSKRFILEVGGDTNVIGKWPNTAIKS